MSATRPAREQISEDILLLLPREDGTIQPASRRAHNSPITRREDVWLTSSPFTKRKSISRPLP
jgi:hypothetical protein